jgi:hypothetical protein
VGKPAGLVQGLREQTVMSTPIRAALWISGYWDHLLSEHAVVADAMLGRQFDAVAGPLDDDLVDSVRQAVQRRIAQDRILGRRVPTTRPRSDLKGCRSSLDDDAPQSTHTDQLLCRALRRRRPKSSRMTRSGAR